MKTIDCDNEDNNLHSYSTSKEITDLLIDNKHKTDALQCNPELIKSYNVLKSTPMGHKDYFYQRVLCKNGVTQDFRSQSLPNSLDEKNKTNGNVDTLNCCDIKSKLLPQQESPPVSPTQELWFKTWPERYDKLKSDCSPDDTMSTNSSKATNTHFTSETCDISLRNGTVKNKLTLNEALQNISLAYSPVTKQLHLVECVTKEKHEDNKLTEEDHYGKKTGHRRTEAGSFSSTVSSLSDSSPSGSLLDAEERSLQNFEDQGAKPRKRSIGNFFTK